MFALIGDAHIEKQNVEVFLNQPERQIESVLKALREILEKCRRLGIKYVIQAGDLFDTPFPSQAAITALASLLNEFNDLSFVVIPGNHDRVSIKTHSLTTLGWIGEREALPLNVVLSPTVMKIDGQKVWVCPHPFVQPPPKKVDWCIGHFPWTGAKRDNGTVNESTHKNPDGNWLLGDFHTEQEGKGYHYAGSITQLSRQELGRKGFLVVDGKDVKFVEISKSYDIRTHVLKKSKDLQTLAKKDGDGVPIYWWIKITDPDVVMPKNWQTDFPHVLNYEEPRRAANQNNPEVVDRFVWSNDPLEGLPLYLKDRSVPDKQAAKIQKLATKLHKNRAKGAVA